MVSMCGVMVDSTKETGSIIKCMERDSTNGKMEECILGNISMIKSMDLGHIRGLTDANTQDNGQTANDMEEGRLFL